MTNPSRNQITKGLKESWAAAVQINLGGKKIKNTPTQMRFRTP